MRHDLALSRALARPRPIRPATGAAAAWALLAYLRREAGRRLSRPACIGAAAVWALLDFLRREEGQRLCRRACISVAIAVFLAIPGRYLVALVWPAARPFMGFG